MSAHGGGHEGPKHAKAEEGSGGSSGGAFKEIAKVFSPEEISTKLGGELVGDPATNFIMEDLIVKPVSDLLPLDAKSGGGGH